MANPLMSIVEGWTGALPFTLQVDQVPADLSGLTVRIVLKTADGVIVKNTTEGVSVTGTTSGQIAYAPSSSSGTLFVAASSPYRVRFSVSDPTPRTVYFPNDEEALIEVNPL